MSKKLDFIRCVLYNFHVKGSNRLLFNKTFTKKAFHHKTFTIKKDIFLRENAFLMVIVIIKSKVLAKYLILLETIF